MLAAAAKEYAASATAEADLTQLFNEYAAADYGWTPTSEKIAEIEWNTINAALFEGVAPSRSQKLGVETIALFDSVAQLPDITAAERECLSQLQASGASNEPTAEEKAFFRLHYRELQTNLPLFSRWERYIMEKAVEDSDFLNGLARCMRVLRPRSVSGTPWKIAAKAGIVAFLEGRIDASEFIGAAISRGLHRNLTAEAIEHHVGERITIDQP